MKNIKVVIEYDGKSYVGWQKQPNKISIQGEIERALKEITGEEIEVIGSGRTDAGVHAIGQVANFKTNSIIPIEKIPYAINSKLKNSIVVKHAEIVDEKFHARYSCVGKKYRYIINNSSYGTALGRNYEYNFPIKLDVNKIRDAAKQFIGEYDFKAFRASGTSNKNTIRRIDAIEIKEDLDRILIDYMGNGFLYNMVRIISGTLVEVGIGKIGVEEIPKIIESKDRTKAGKTLPAHGLYLLEVYY